MKSNSSHNESNIELQKEMNDINEINEYLEQLDLKEKMVYKIAIEHLGTSFNILRSNGFSEWKKSKIKK